MKFTDILLPTDLSEASLPATVCALDMAHQFGSTLHLLYVMEEPVVYVPLGGYYPNRDEWESYAESGLENWISQEDAEGLNIVRQKVFGHPASAIVQYAKEHDIDLIVLGTHGRSAIPALVMGSVAENVVRLAPCPVMTVRPDQHDTSAPEVETACETL